MFENIDVIENFSANRQVEETEEEFAIRIWNFLNFTNENTIPGINSVITEFNTFTSVFSSRFAFANYQGDYKSDKIYTLGQSASFGGAVYYSKVELNQGNQPDLNSDPNDVNATWASSTASHAHGWDEIQNKPTKLSDFEDDLEITWSNVLNKPELFTKAEVEDMFNNFEALPALTNNNDKYLKIIDGVPTWVNITEVVKNDDETSADVTWSSAKITEKINERAKVNDIIQSSTTTWSSNKIATVIGNTFENLTLINDILVSTSTTWSSEKIKDTIDNLVIDVNTTPAAQLSKTTINDNSLTNHEVVITNYNSVNTYNVFIDDESVATILRVDGTININFLENISSLTKTATVTVYTYHSDYTLSGISTITLQNHSVTVPDELLQVVDFSLVEESKTDFTYDNGSLLASTDNASFTSIDVEQDEIDSNWSSYTAELKSSVTVDEILGVAVDGGFIVNNTNFATADEVEVHGLGANLTTSVTQTSSLSSTTGFGNITSVAGYADYDYASGLAVSEDGKWFYAIRDSIVLYKQNAIAFIPANTGAMTQVDLSEYITNANTVGFYNNGKILYLIDSLGNFVEFELSTPFDITTRTLLRLGNFSIASAILSQWLPFNLSKNGKYLYVCKNGALNTIAIYQYVLAVPFDLSTATYTSLKSVTLSNQYSNSCYIANDGLSILIKTTTAIYRYTLSIAYTIASMSTSGSLICNTSAETNSSGIISSPGGEYIYFLGNTSDAIRRVYSSSNASTSTWMMNPSKNIKFIDSNINFIPNAVSNVENNSLKIATANSSLELSLIEAIPSTTTKEFDFTNNKLFVTRTYNKVEDSFRFIKFEINSSKNNTISQVKIEMTKESV